MSMRVNPFIRKIAMTMRANSACLNQKITFRLFPFQQKIAFVCARKQRYKKLVWILFQRKIAFVYARKQRFKKLVWILFQQKIAFVYACKQCLRWVCTDLNVISKCKCNKYDFLLACPRPTFNWNVLFCHNYILY